MVIFERNGKNWLCFSIPSKLRQKPIKVFELERYGYGVYFRFLLRVVLVFWGLYLYASREVKSTDYDLYAFAVGASALLMLYQGLGGKVIVLSRCEKFQKAPLVIGFDLFLVFLNLALMNIVYDHVFIPVVKISLVAAFGFILLSAYVIFIVMLSRLHTLD